MRYNNYIKLSLTQTRESPQIFLKILRVFTWLKTMFHTSSVKDYVFMEKALLFVYFDT